MTVTRTWRLVDPVARVRATTAEAPAATERPIATVAFFSNSKQHAAEIEAAIATALAGAHAIEPRFYAKPNASVGATPELLRTIAAECQAAVVGSGD